MTIKYKSVLITNHIKRLLNQNCELKDLKKWIVKYEKINHLKSLIVEHEIGTKFKTRGKAPRLCTVIDILKTYNSKNELVSIRYVASHEFLGQTVIDRDVVATTITMGLIK